VPTSEEVLSSPSAPVHRVRRALLGALGLALLGWVVLDKVSGPDDPGSAAAPSSLQRSGGSSESSSGARPVVIPPPPWVRYPTPLEGRWVGDGSRGRVTLVISNARLTLLDGTQRQGVARTLGSRTITVSGHRVHVRPSTDRAATATYRWRIRGDDLTFELVESTAKAGLPLESLAFHRV
jgi:hypothetical protein